MMRMLVIGGKCINSLSIGPYWITLFSEVTCMISCGNHDSWHLSFFPPLLLLLPFSILYLQFHPFPLSVSNPFPLTSFVSRAQTTVDCIHIDLGRYVMASYPLLDNVTESLVIPYRSPLHPPPRLTPEPCPVIPQASHLANPARVRMTPSKFLHLVNASVALI